MKTTIGAFVLTQLKALSIRTVFGTPGDYNLELLELIEHDDQIDFIGSCNELNAGYAADGYARIHGVSALVTTYSVGDLAVLSAIAGAYAESVPIIFLTGAPPLYAREHRLLLHHSLADGQLDHNMICFRQFTADQLLITPENAAQSLPRVISRAYIEKKPVYLQLPSDISDVEIDVPDTPYDYVMPQSDARRLQMAAEALSRRLERAEMPVMLVDHAVARFGLSEMLCAFARRFSIPIVSMSTAKGVIPENDPQWLGNYSGDLSRPDVLRRLDEADCTLSFGVKPIDLNTNFFSTSPLFKHVVQIAPFSLTMDADFYPAVATADLLRAVMLALPERERARPVVPSPTVTRDLPWGQSAFWQRMQTLLQPDDVVVVDIGTSTAGVMGLSLPEGVTVVGQPLWGAIGYSLPALLGTLLAAPQRRHVLFVGDGAFQISCQKLATLMRLGLAPIIFLLNNNGYTIERYILGENSSYNTIPSMRYTELLHAMGGGEEVVGTVVENGAQLDAALEHARHAQSLTLIEVRLAEMDGPQALKALCSNCNRFNFGITSPRRS
ncbi:alpha-keto acid decarboxylase family protein [Lonsdalea britannica]|uniref:alpha-keto acid decarboxylase family protein n=1 Tax=Lonsdalea britannica TaxID=1082704 RepID=UPI0026EFAF8F|nr:thiamine pyrophosphate-binding protein [Lonsdalea britannica]